MIILFINAADSSEHTPSANASLYPNLGILTLMSSLKNSIKNSYTIFGYIDGSIYSNSFIKEYIYRNYFSISVICFSVLTANYNASVKLANFSRFLNSKIITIFGNDHFSAVYQNVMRNQPNICYGFYGNDVVEGFTDFVSDIILCKSKPLCMYPGLVYRDEYGSIKRNYENPDEYFRLSFVDYSLSDTIFPHSQLYLKAQHTTYDYLRKNGFRSQVVDIGRGCLKFNSKLIDGIPKNACDFCGIIPGINAVSQQTANRAWLLLKNAYDQGYNYFYITADELPLTFWSLLKEMSLNIPSWYANLTKSSKPKMFGYARTDSFGITSNKINILVDKLGFDHFFIGFDGFSKISLDVMNKRLIRDNNFDMMQPNMDILQKISSKGCLITAGLVITHIGITKDILDDNYRNLEKIISNYPSTFVALDFGPLCPIPGSHSFRYLIDPEFAKVSADKYGLSINVSYLNSVKHKYLHHDIFDIDELVNDFILGCCNDVTINDVHNQLERIKSLAHKYSIVVGGGV